MVLRQRWRDRVRGNSDAGFGMVELLFSMVVFTIIATAVAYGLQSATNATRQDRNRVQAASLASRELEIVRQEFQDISIDGPALIGDAGTVTNPHPLKSQTAGNPLTIDGLPFTVTRSASWMPAGVGSSACDGGSAVTYPVLAVNVEVTWAQMGSTQPVESNTILTPRKSQIIGTDAYAAVKVVAADGSGVAGMPVTISSGATTLTSSTADDGCATFQLTATATPVAYTATASKLGYVSNTYTPTATGSLSVKAGTLARTSLAYDKAVTLVVNQTTTGGFALPAQNAPVTLYSPDIVGGTKSFPGSGASTTITGLWPSTAGYISWPGTCKQSDPSASGGTRQSAVVITAGGGGAATHTLTPVRVTVRNSVSNPVVGTTVTAVPSVTAEAPCSQVYNPVTLGSTNSSGQLSASLPAGTWTIKANGFSATAFTVNSASAQKNVTVTVTP
jgi:type II secretory pathway pseudopilin PulG